MTLLRRGLAVVLVTVGLAALGWSGSILGRADYARRVIARELPATASPPRRGATLGLLEIPRLELTSVVVEGDDEASLLVATAHLPETPLPWRSGNSVLAAHRDTDFRPLKDIRIGDVVRFHTADTTVAYVVRETRIVEPTDVSVLRPTTGTVLTLITCYPFHYVGPAPKRFIVRAERTAIGRDIL